MSRFRDFLLLCGAAILIAFAITIGIGISGVAAHDQSDPNHAWYNSQEINPAARQRLGITYKSCCDNGDVFKTRFRAMSRTEDGWEYLKDGKWKLIPPDIIKEEDTPDRQPTLFINKWSGQELCFFLPKGGI